MTEWCVECIEFDVHLSHDHLLLHHNWLLALLRVQWCLAEDMADENNEEADTQTVRNLPVRTHNLKQNL